MFGRTSPNKEISPLSRQEKLNSDAKYLQAEFASADKFFDRGDLSEAKSGYERVLKRFPDNLKASAGIKKIELARSHERFYEEAEVLVKANDLEAAKAKINLIISENPSDEKARKKLAQLDTSASTESLKRLLSAAFRKPISIDFQNANLKQVFTVIGQTAGLNFIFDKDVKLDQPVTLTLNNTTVEAAIYSMLTINQLEQQVMDEKTLLIYPNNSVKAKDYQQTVVKSFMLTNARAKGVADSLKTILKSREIVVDEKLNMLIVRDSPEALSMVDKIIALQDQPEPEVILELEVLEVTHERMLELGIALPTGVDLTLLSPNAKLSDLAYIRSNNVTATLGSAGIKAGGKDSDFDILASPRVRVINREKAKILVGDKVPTFTSTIIPGVAGPSTSQTISYIDVGLKLELEPTIYLNGDVAIRVALEVSNIVSEIPGLNGSVAYRVGNRNANTMLRLKDGENQILAGLINNSTERTINKFAGLGDLPLLGNLFRSRKNNDKKTEILLSITPRIVRNLQRQDANLSEFMGGTDNSLRVRPDFKVNA
ncbi:MAG: secretin N-terminal domain-containing protein, partial [Betaproteobacteria bacterium]